ncbi:MAG: HD domain-containing phosphohydrolase [Mizugakiibacter sp.]|uniref:HD-GYP domain-containing protein n=1 Tax=Mizugakiibacter sp. TaxID=1972610 RepID=UPI0031C4C5A3|nr:phosphohydrolase [Xanthomonadaceae bacterium]
MPRRRIERADIAVGTPLPWDVYEAKGVLLLRQGAVVATERQLEKLIAFGLFIDADVTRAHDESAQAPPERSPLALILEARRQLEAACVLRSPGDELPAQVWRIAGLLREACSVNPDVALAAIMLQRDAPYSVRHAVDSATACHVVGAALGMSAVDAVAATSAALTMNLSMMALRDALQYQQAPLSDDQRRSVHEHPQRSAQMLIACGVEDAGWIEAVRHHHEVIDGSGYPARKRGADIPYLAQIVALADVYCARVSGRAYRPALDSRIALRRIFLDEGVPVDRELAGQFIRVLGVYPPGAVVRLNNGDIAVVIQRGESGTTPRVGSVIGPGGLRMVTPIRRDTSEPAYAIRDSLPRDALGESVNMRALWGKDAALD